MLYLLQVLIMILVLTVLYFPYCRAHAYVILDRLSRKPDKIIDEDYHKKWHDAFTHFRILLHLTFGVVIYYWSNDFWLAFKLTAIGAVYATAIYDSIINHYRELPVIPFIGTVDFPGDFDAFWIWLRDHGINHLVFKFLILAITITLTVVL